MTIMLNVFKDVNFKFLFILCLIFIEKHLQDSETFLETFFFLSNLFMCFFVFFLIYSAGEYLQNQLVKILFFASGRLVRLFEGSCVLCTITLIRFCE